jgi:hypothetical protein
MGIQATVLIAAMIVLVLNHRREVANYEKREQQLYAAVLSKGASEYAAVLDALRTDPVTRTRIMEIENELALNAQKVVDQERATGFPIT